MISHKQLSVEDIYSDCQNIFENDKPAFLSLLETHIDLDEIIPVSFYNHFYASTGRSRKYPLTAMIWALIIQRVFSIPTDRLLLTFLAYSKPLREFCGFTKVPDASKITRFKQDFLDELQTVFERLVDVTEPICQAIDSAKADMTIFDSSGIEAFVTENNPKYANTIVKQLKAYYLIFFFYHPEICSSNFTSIARQSFCTRGFPVSYLPDSTIVQSGTYSISKLNSSFIRMHIHKKAS